MNKFSFYNQLKKTCDTSPSAPGIYIMKDVNDRVIYIGKAKNLKKRIISYSHYIKNELVWKLNKNDCEIMENKDHNGRWKTIALLKKISEIEFIITDNEMEALLLESNLIKKYRPVFNIDLKDQERYTYLKITYEEFPRLLVSRKNRKGEFTGPPGEIIGPFVYGSSRLISIGTLRKIFKVRICNRLPKKPCLEFFIKNCDAPCIKNTTKEEYGNNIGSLKDLLKNTEDLRGFLVRMNKEMTEASNKQNYELAKDIRDTIKIIEKLRIQQKIDTRSNKNEEYVGYKVDLTSQKGHVLIFKRINGVICDRKKFEFDLLGDNSFSTFLLQYYSSVLIPNIIYVNVIPESKTNLEIIFQKLSDHPVKIKKISNLSSDDKNSNLMDLILKNLALYIERKYNLTLISLKEVINLKELPYIIDCFDVSNLGDSFAVGSCVRFINGVPFKKGYRRFRIKTIKNKQDDFAMINEIVRRRYIPKKKYNKKSNSKLETYLSNVPLGSMDKFIESDPNLILIDGGKGQLNAALKALSAVDLEIPMISLAKENEEIFLPNLDRSLKLPRRNPALQLLQSIRDESHRFGVTYNRTLRKIRYSKTIFSKENITQ